MLRKGRAILVSARDHIDGLLHPRRRARSIERLRSVSPRESTTSILFVCLGNVCRSPYAAWAFQGTVVDSDRLTVEVDSAGFIGPGRNPPEAAIDAARERDVDHASNVSKLLTPTMIEAADAIFVFDRANLRKLREMEGTSSAAVFLLGDFDPRWDGKRAIVDPWGKSLDEFRRTFERIDRCLDTVHEALRTTSGNSAVTPREP